jgi:repressor LexA
LFQEEEVLRAIQEWVVRFGLPPTLEELRDRMGVGSTRTVMRYLQGLEKKGAIERWRGSRGIRLRRAPTGGYQTVAIPIVGRVTAGPPLEAVEDVEGWIRIPMSSVRGRSDEHFLLRIVGDSMDKAEVGGVYIRDGDLALVRQQPIAAEGDVVVAMIDGECTIKRLKKHSGYYVLQPESSNANHQPIIMDTDFRILGIVRRVFRNGAGICRVNGDEPEEGMEYD